MNLFLKILVPIIALMIMIVVHEWGHFIAARFFKLPVYEFSIGMGKLIKQHKSKKTGTKWSLRMLPIGGYCAFDDIEDLKKESKDKLGETTSGLMDNALDRIPMHQKVIISLAGPLMNIFLAIFITFSIFLFTGGYYSSSIKEIINGSAAYENGSFQAGDKILKVNNIDIKNKAKNVSEVLKDYHGNNPIEIEYQRGNQILKNKIIPQYNKEENRYIFGFNFKKINQIENPIVAAKMSFQSTIEVSTLVVRSIGDLLSGKHAINEVSGIVGTVDIMGNYVKPDKTAILTFLSFCSMISINLGVFNLLPLPVLDGGKILVAIIEKLFRRKINRKVLEAITIGSFIILLGLMVIVTGFDIFKMSTGANKI